MTTHQWHTDFTQWSWPVKRPAPATLDSEKRTFGGVQEAQEFCWTLADFLFIKLGRPRWFLDADITEVLLHSKIENQSLHGLVFPYDSFNLIFEKSTKLASDFEPKFISVCSPRSALAAKLGGESMRALVKAFDNHPFEENFLVKSVVCKPGSDCDTVSLSTVPLSMPMKDAVDIVSRPENVVMGENTPENMDGVIEQVIKIVVAALLYYNARPDLYVQEPLPRDQRYRFGGDAEDRKNMHRILLPMTKKISARPAATGTGAPKRPHYRGFVLRTLRDERYRRKPDGSFRTVLVEPTAIHPELLDLDERQ